MASERLTDHDLDETMSRVLDNRYGHTTVMSMRVGDVERLVAEIKDRRAADPVARIAANNEHTCFLTGWEMEALKLARKHLDCSTWMIHQRHDPIVKAHIAECDAALAVLDKILGGDRGTPLDDAGKGRG